MSNVTAEAESIAQVEATKKPAKGSKSAKKAKVTKRAPGAERSDKKAEAIAMMKRAAARRFHRVVAGLF